MAGERQAPLLRAVSSLRAPAATKMGGISWDNGDSASAYYECEGESVDADGEITKLRCRIEEHHKPWMIDNGEWIAEGTFSGHAGFHIWAGYSLFPNASWSNLVAEWMRVHKDPALLQTFVNLVLGETWEERGEEVDGHALQGRVEAWNEAPAGVLIVTCGVDVQGDRLEIERVGWGVEEESWSLDHHAIYGDPSSPEIWAQLEEYLLTPTSTEDSRELAVAATCIDSGGHSTDAVYNFVRDKTRRRVWAIKGQAGTGRPVWPKAGQQEQQRTHSALHGRRRFGEGYGLRTAPDSQSWAGILPFPKDRDPNWFGQLTSETIVTRYVKGFPARVWTPKPNTRQEALDCRVYAFAALRSMSISWGKVRRIVADQAKVKAEMAVANVPPAAVAAGVLVKPAPAPQPQKKPVTRVVARFSMLGR